MPLRRYLGKGDGVIDVGAHHGDYTKQYAATVGPSGRVLAVEPDPASAAECAKACAGLPQVSVHVVALGATSGDTAVYTRGRDRRHGSLWPENVIAPTEAVHVTVARLDDLAETVPRLRGVKMDAQGAEGLILKGAQKTLANPQVAWFVELWPLGLANAGTPYTEVVEMFRDAGLHPHGITWDSLLRTLSEHKGHSARDWLFTYGAGG